MAIICSILKTDAENGELFVYRSVKEFPKASSFHGNLQLQLSAEDQLNLHRANWFSTAERIKVAEGEADKFRRFIRKTKGYGEQTSFGIKVTPMAQQAVLDDLKEGIEIPDTCYEVRRGDMLFPEDSRRLVYFKSPVVQEKEVKDNLASEGATNVFLGHSAYCSCLQCKPLTSKSSFNSRESTDTPSPQELKEQEDLWAEIINEVLHLYNRENMLQRKVAKEIMKDYIVSRK